MADDLKRALEKYEADLKTDPGLRDQFFQAMQGMKNKWDRPVHADEELVAWKRILKEFCQIDA
jgi:hypothetical protein